MPNTLITIIAAAAASTIFSATVALPKPASSNNHHESYFPPVASGSLSSPSSSGDPQNDPLTKYHIHVDNKNLRLPPISPGRQQERGGLASNAAAPTNPYWLALYTDQKWWNEKFITLFNSDNIPYAFDACKAKNGLVKKTLPPDQCAQFPFLYFRVEPGRLGCRTRKLGSDVLRELYDLSDDQKIVCYAYEEFIPTAYRGAEYGWQRDRY